jgi:hypothetical protein
MAALVQWRDAPCNAFARKALALVRSLHTLAQT